MNEITREIQNELTQKAKENIKTYNKKIIASEYPFVGVSIPALRKLAREYRGRAEEVFFRLSPDSFESVLLKGLMLNYVKADFDKLWEMTAEYLGLCDNWAHIDCFFSGFVYGKKYNQEFNERFSRLTDSENVFIRRAVAVFNMDFRLTCDCINETLNTLYSIKSGDYYCDMAIAWALATAFAKHYETTTEFMKSHSFSPEIRKMTVGKCRDSFRLTQEQKIQVKRLMTR